MASVARLVRVALVGASVVLVADALARDRAPACAAWDVEYALAGTLQLTDTPFGKANGTHKVGPGKLVLRFEENSARVSLRSYTMRQSIRMAVTAFFATIHITADSTTSSAPDGCGVAAEGALEGNTLLWKTRVRAVRTEGTLTCAGAKCGSFGSPAPGSSPIKIGPQDMRVRAFEFSSDRKTFTMPFTLGAKTESPKQTSFLALTGHEVKRTCVPQPPPCRP